MSQTLQFIQSAGQLLGEILQCLMERAHFSHSALPPSPGGMQGLSEVTGSLPRESQLILQLMYPQLKVVNGSVLLSEQAVHPLLQDVNLLLRLGQ